MQFAENPKVNDFNGVSLQKALHLFCNFLLEHLKFERKVYYCLF